MIAYVDASVLLRVAMRQPDALPEWRQIRQGVSSASILTESLRTTILQLIASLDIVEMDVVVLDGAAQPMPTEVGTLDAIHLATALLWKEMSRIDLVMATHDAALGLAAKAHGLQVVGQPAT
jgi:predicted nucleic acid-binding protein